jgi:hypothetical protein
MSAFVENTNRIANNFRTELQARLKAAGNKSRNRYGFTVRARKERRSGKTISLGVSMVKHAIFKEKGVGRGRGINSGKTKPDPIYNPIMEAMIPKLADDLALNYADLITRSLIK